MSGGTRSWVQLLNPLLTLLPLGVFGSTVLFDYAAQTSGVRLFGEVAHGDMAIGIVVGTVCLCTQLVDILVAAPMSPTRRALGPVATGTGVMVVLFAGVWSVRVDGDLFGSPALFVTEFLALAAGIVGAWFARGIVVGPPPEQDFDDSPTVVGLDEPDSGYNGAALVRETQSPDTWQWPSHESTSVARAGVAGPGVLPWVGANSASVATAKAAAWAAASKPTRSPI